VRDSPRSWSPSFRLTACQRRKPLRDPSGEIALQRGIFKAKHRIPVAREPFIEFDNRTSERRLFADPAHAARGPAWSRDGRELYVWSGTCLRAISVADGGSREVACPGEPAHADGLPELPAVAPDGRQLAVAIDVGGCFHVAVIEPPW